MTVFVLTQYWYDYTEYAGGNMVLGVFSSEDNAIKAREQSLEEETLEAVDLGYITEIDFDDTHTPTLIKFNQDHDERYEITYQIHEWKVQ